MNGFLRDRVRLTAGLLLGISAACTAALLWGAGENAAQAFSARRERQSAQAVSQGRQTDSLAALLPLAGYTVAVDPGHGGYDGGAVGRVSGIPEKGLNLDVALRLARLLEAKGARVVMTREDDRALCDEHPPIRKKLQDMQRRAVIITEGGADMVLSIHMNEYAGRGESGPQVFYRQGADAGRLLAGCLQEALIAQKPLVRAYLTDDIKMEMINGSAALVECGFLSNREEEALLLTEEYRERVAQAICAGVVAWAALPGERPEPLPAVDRSDEPNGLP